jgi:hypothetical protein
MISVADARIWGLEDNEEKIHINITDFKEFPKQVEIIKEVIFSEDVYEIDNALTGKGDAGTTLYYPGWVGALKAASTNSTVFSIPTNFQIVDSTYDADITINLVSYGNPNGYAGFTEFTTNQHNQILESRITIYDIDSHTNQQLSTIMRHEMGHALGLMHSTASEDLMAPTMIDEFPYISECDVDAISLLYDYKRLDTITCEK